MKDFIVRYHMHSEGRCMSNVLLYPYHSVCFYSYTQPHKARSSRSNTALFFTKIRHVLMDLFFLLPYQRI